MEELAWRERGRLWLRLGLRLALTAAALGLTAWLGRLLLRLLMPFVVALILTWMLNPAIAALEKRLKVGRRWLALALVGLGVALLGALAAWLVYALAAQALSLLGRWESVWKAVTAGFEAVAAWAAQPLSRLPDGVYQRLMALGDSVIAWLGDAVPGALRAAAGGAGAFAMGLPRWVLNVVVCAMATYFISADYPALRSGALKCVPPVFRGFFAQVKGVAREALGGYVKAQLILSFWVSVVLLLGFWLIGQSYALLLAVALGILDFIPIIGSGTVLVPWALVDVALGNCPHAGGLMAIWGAVALLRRLAEPKLVGDHTGLSPIASLVSIYVGLGLGGVAGMILGPVVCLILWNLARSGFLDNTRRDLRLATLDLCALLRAGAGKGDG